MQHLEVSGAVGHIYVIRQLKVKEGLLECYAVWFGRLTPAVWGEPGVSVSGVEESLVGKSGAW
jgi:hypothetical protein